MKMQRVLWLNSTLSAKVHLMNFDHYNYQTPRWPDCRTSKKCSGDIGPSENNSAENFPWGRKAIASSKSKDKDIKRRPRTDSRSTSRDFPSLARCVLYTGCQGWAGKWIRHLQRHRVDSLQQHGWLV